MWTGLGPHTLGGTHLPGNKHRRLQPLLRQQVAFKEPAAEDAWQKAELEPCPARLRTVVMQR